MKNKTYKLVKLEKNRLSLFLDNENECFFCNSTYKLTWHEIFRGRNRQNSMKYKLCLRMCLNCHELYQENINLPINRNQINIANQELENSSFNLKQNQLEVIQKNNPMTDDYHVGIRSIEDIKTWEEVLQLDDDIEGQFAWGDYTRDDAEQTLKEGKIKIYSSNPIKQGSFVSTSYIQAEEYAGGRGNKIYEKIVPLNEVAGINGDEGQYARVQPNVLTVTNYQQGVKLPIAKEQNNSNINNVNNVSQETIDKYENAKETIDRKTLLEVADTLEIYFKKGAIATIDENMSKRAGNNKTPKIIDVSSFDKTGNLEILTREVNDLAKEMYSNNQNKYTLVENIDTNTNFELGNLGIDKTFSKNVPFEKLPTYNKLKEIGEQGLYYKTSYDANKKDGIKYHHFLTPVKVINTEGNAFIRTVVKEYTKDIGQNNKFYYHQIEYLDNRKGITDTSHIGNRTFGNPLTDNIIANNNENVKLPLVISNNNMQKNENDTVKLSKTENPLEISNETNKIVDGNHRIFIANRLGLTKVPVKFIDSSKDIVLDNREWYNNIEGELNDKRSTTFTTNEGMQNESRYDNRSYEISKRISSDGPSNTVSSKNEANNNRPSIETIYGRNTPLE